MFVFAGPFWLKIQTNSNFQSVGGMFLDVLCVALEFLFGLGLVCEIGFMFGVATFALDAFLGRRSARSLEGKSWRCWGTILDGPFY